MNYFSAYTVSITSCDNEFYVPVLHAWLILFRKFYNYQETCGWYGNYDVL